MWEITPGIVTDVEVDEVFVVLSGHATLRREDGSESELVAGTVGRSRGRRGDRVGGARDAAQDLHRVAPRSCAN
ncbi:MAG: cupin domain-containing protein [Microcella pacifica]